MFSYFSSSSDQKDQQDAETVKPIQYPAKYKIDNFPPKINKPSEMIRLENMTSIELKLVKYIETNYEKEIQNFQFFPYDIIPRFVTDTFYVKNYDKRLKLTKKRFEQYIAHHSKFHYDDILTLASLNTDIQKQIIAENELAVPLYLYGIDYEGHPILWDSGKQYGSGDKINQTFCKTDNFDRANFWRARMQRATHNLKLKLSEYYQAKIFQIIIVMDIGNASFSDFYQNRSFHQWHLRTASELFPETVFKIFWVNAPWAFQAIWKIMSAFLDKITVEKTIICGTDYLNKLSEYIDINQIPKEFGGNGMLTPRPGNVPVGFPFTLDNINDNNANTPSDNGNINSDDNMKNNSNSNDNIDDKSKDVQQKQDDITVCQKAVDDIDDNDITQ